MGITIIWHTSTYTVYGKNIQGETSAVRMENQYSLENS